MSASCELSPVTPDSTRELKVLAAFVAVFLFAFYLPVGVPRFDGVLREALALLLAGPSLSLPSMRVLRSIMGTPKTMAYVSLVVAMATLTGLLYGAL